VFAGVEARDDRVTIAPPRRPRCQRRMKPCSCTCAPQPHRVLVRHPARVTLFNVDAVRVIIRRRCAPHHVTLPSPGRCGCRVVLKLPGKFPSTATRFHDVLVAFRRGATSTLQRAFKMNGAMAFTSCTSSNSTDGTSASSSRHELRSANPPAANPDPCGLRETILLRGEFVRQQRHL